MKKKWEFEPADDVRDLMKDLVDKLEFKHIKLKQVYCVRSNGSKAKAYARVWGLQRIFQMTAGYKPTYVIEVLSQHFDKLSDERKARVIIHELLHIPKTFSGALLSHRGRHHAVNDRVVERYFKELKKSKKRKLFG